MDGPGGMPFMRWPADERLSFFLSEAFSWSIRALRHVVPPDPFVSDIASNIRATAQAALETPSGPEGPGFVYVLRCSDARLTYVGWTVDVARRLASHNAGRGARFTRGRQWTLLHVEAFPTRREAMQREWKLKRDRAARRALLLRSQS